MFESGDGGSHERPISARMPAVNRQWDLFVWAMSLPGERPAHSGPVAKRASLQLCGNDARLHANKCDIYRRVFAMTGE